MHPEGVRQKVSEAFSLEDKHKPTPGVAWGYVVQPFQGQDKDAALFYAIRAELGGIGFVVNWPYDLMASEASEGMCNLMRG